MKPLPPQVHGLLKSSAQARLRAEEGLEMGFDLVAVSPELRLAGRALIAAADLIDVEAQLAAATTPKKEPTT